MRKELKIIGSRDRHVFTATFIRFGFRDGYKGPVKTILLQDVLLDDKIVTDHLWFDLTKGFESADLLPGDVVEFCARVSIYEKGYNEGVVPAVEGCVGYTNEEFERVNKENNDPESAKIGSFNKTVEEANNIRSRVLKYVDKIKQERAYNIDLCMTFERYIEIADKDAERAMAFLKEAYPFNEETEVFIRKRYNMSIDVNPEEN